MGVVLDREDVLRTLRAHEGELRAAGVVHLRLFGSVARGDNDAESDVDLMADYDDAMQLGILAKIGIKHRLEDLLDVKVDLAQADQLRSHVAPGALHDAHTAF